MFWRPFAFNRRGKVLTALDHRSIRSAAITCLVFTRAVMRTPCQCRRARPESLVNFREALFTTTCHGDNHGMSGLDQASLIVRRGRSGHRERSLCRTAVALVFVAVFASAAAAQNNPAPNNQTCGRPANALAPITVVPAVIQPDAIV